MEEALDVAAEEAVGPEPDGRQRRGHRSDQSQDNADPLGGPGSAPGEARHEELEREQGREGDEDEEQPASPEAHATDRGRARSNRLDKASCSRASSNGFEITKSTCVRSAAGRT